MRDQTAFTGRSLRLFAVAAAVAAGGCVGEAPGGSIYFVEPAPGETIAGTTRVEIAAAPDGWTGEVSLLVGGVEVARLAGDPLVAELDTALFPDGPLELSAAAMAAGGGDTATASLSVRVDNLPPTLAVLPARAAFREDGDQFVVRLLARDDSGIEELGVRVIGDLGEATRTVAAPDELPALSFDWDQVRPGPIADWTEVRVVAQAVDGFGRISEIEQPFALGTRMRWRHNTAGLMVRPPLVADDGTVFVGTTKVSPDEGRIARIDPADGHQLCERPLGLETPYSATQAGDLVVFATSRAIRAIRRDDCSLAWTFGDPVGSPRSYWGTPAFDAATGRVYAASAEGDLVAIDALSGSGSLLAATGDQIQSSPVVGPGGEILVGTLGGRMFGFAADGSPLSWSPYPAAGSLFGDPVVAGNRVYFGSMDTYLYALDPASGAMAAGFGVSPDGFAIRSTPAIAPDGTVLVATVGGNLHAIGGDGTLRWKFATGPISRGGVRVAATASGWIAYLGSTDGRVYAIDQDGSQRWKADTGAAIQTYGTLGGDAFYTPSDDFHLYAYAIGAAPER